MRLEPVLDRLDRVAVLVERGRDGGVQRPPLGLAALLPEPVQQEVPQQRVVDEPPVGTAHQQPRAFHPAREFVGQAEYALDRGRHHGNDARRKRGLTQRRPERIEELLGQVCVQVGSRAQVAERGGNVARLRGPLHQPRRQRDAERPALGQLHHDLDVLARRVLAGAPPQELGALLGVEREVRGRQLGQPSGRSHLRHLERERSPARHRHVEERQLRPEQLTDDPERVAGAVELLGVIDHQHERLDQQP